MNIHKKAGIIFIIGSAVVSGCQAIASMRATPTPAATPTPLPPKDISICVGYEPETLYLYAGQSKVKDLILEAIYDGPIDWMENGASIPVIFDNFPAFEAGSARFTPMDVQEGDEIVDATGMPTVLKNGSEVFPSGCTNPGCALIWDGETALQMDALSADFQLKANLKWSDGEPLKASDSVFSFHMADDPQTNASKLLIDQTAVYQALDEKTVQWQGKPGLVTDEFEKYFWTPLPEHRFGTASASEMILSEEAREKPLGWGPFKLADWAAGSHIRMDRNPFYFRVNELMPFFDTVFFRFIDKSRIDELADCDVVTDSVLDLSTIEAFLASPTGSEMALVRKPSNDLELLAIGIKPASYDDNYYPYGVDRPDIFGDPRTRQAIASCIDHALITEKMLGGQVERASSVLPSNDKLLANLALPALAYDPDRGMALLAEVGWRDLDLNPQTPITALQVANVPPGTAFSVTIRVPEIEMQTAIASEIAGNLAACGIQAEVALASAEELFKPGPDGIVFGRNFDLALMPMRFPEDFDCRYFATGEIPSDGNYWLGEVTGGANFYGYSSASFDQACQAARRAGLDSASRISTAGQAIGLLADELPLIPLFHYPEFFATSNEICGLEDAADYISPIAAIESLKAGPACPSQ